MGVGVPWRSPGGGGLKQEVRVTCAPGAAVEGGEQIRADTGPRGERSPGTGADHRGSRKDVMRGEE